MDYKDSLILPNTEFPMRGNLPQNEPKTYQKWQQENLYDELTSINANASTSFNIHDGPPYANGNLHIGHGLNKILKDIITKFHYFQGHNIRYTPGWDCHGLPIEQQVESKLGKEKKQSLSKAKIRELCKEHAQKFISIQADEFKALGVLGDFANPYKTMDFAFESNIYRCLCAIAKEGLLAQRSKPIYWSWACETALADAEVEYKDKVSDSIFVSFKLDSDALDKLEVQNASIIIWTTTPWTLPANSGIALNPTQPYILSTKGFIVAKELHSKLAQILDIGEIAKEFQSKILENTFAINPLNDRKSKIILGEHVGINDGTGAVHTAPGHGEDDYFVGLKYGLEVLMPVDDKGLFSKELESKKLLREPFATQLVGTHIFKAQEKILELLGDSLLKHSKITHSYPHCWRSHEPVIYRATTQWFILLDKPFYQNKTLKELALSELEKITFYPANGKNRIYSMIENRPDWCISRQRDWGVPIAFFIDKSNGEALLEEAVLNNIADIFEKEGCDAWWDKPNEYLLPDSHKHLANNLEKSKHILDVWFDSGSTWSAVLDNKRYNAGAFPASMYLEGSDQHRGWFQSSLLLSCAIAKKAPYKSVLTHGFTFDKNGEKMSKSKGNVIAPAQIIKTQGSEILRLWVALSNYQSDQNISDDILKQVGEQYRKIRNTLRFLLANASGLENLVAKNSLFDMDRWILSVCDENLNLAYKYCKEYEFAKAYQVLMSFLTNELSGIYLDLCKDRLYCDSVDSKKRLAIQSAIAIIARRILHFIAPVLTYTANEAFSYAPEIIKNNHKSVFFLRDFECSEAFNLQTKIDFKRLKEIRDKFSESIDFAKKQKIISSTLELCLYSSAANEVEFLNEWLMVSYVTKSKQDTQPIATFRLDNGEEFIIYRSIYSRCERCWQFLVDDTSCLCPRCKEVLKA